MLLRVYCLIGVQWHGVDFGDVEAYVHFLCDSRSNVLNRVRIFKI